jgi:hypothetical protein
MASETSKTGIVIGIAVLVVVLFVCGMTALIIKLRTHVAQQKALVALEKSNPVEYYVLHTPPARNEEDLKNEMVGTWEMAGLRIRSTGQFIFLPPHNGNFKMFTLTNWSIITYDTYSNVVYTASGRYTLQGDQYTESIEAATGQMKQYLGARPQFIIRLDGDKYYQMSAGKNLSPLEEMWQRVE